MNYVLVVYDEMGDCIVAQGYPTYGAAENTGTEIKIRFGDDVKCFIYSLSNDALLVVEEWLS